MRILFSFSLLTFSLLLIAPQAQAQEPAEPMHYTRLYADDAGDSHFADEAMPMVMVNPGSGIPPTAASAPAAASGVAFLCPAAGDETDWHPAPRRQYNIILSGEIEVEVSDGEVRRFGPGSVLLVENTEGKGHITRVVSDEPACFAGVALATL